MLKRIIWMTLLTLTLVACGGDNDQTVDDLADQTDDAVDQVEDDLSEIYDETREQAAQAEAEIEELLEADSDNLRESRIGRVWDRAVDLSEQAADEARRALEIGQREGGEAWEKARASAESAKQRADAAWDEASEFSGAAWEDVREAAADVRGEAQAAWERLTEFEPSEDTDEDADENHRDN